MGYLLIPLALLNFAVFFSIIFKRRIEETIVISVMFQVAIMFFGGVISNLLIGFYVMIFLEVCALIFNIVSLIKNKGLLKLLGTPGLLVFFAVYLIFFWTNSCRVASVWDEFTHWALVVKHMFSANNFGLASDAPVVAKTYLSGTSIYQVLCMHYFGSFKESVMYIANDIMIFSFILPVFKYFKKFKSASFWLTFAGFLLLPMLFYPLMYQSLYVDGILGIVFGYTLFTYFDNTEDGNQLFCYLSTMLGFMMLIFIKDFGTPLSLIAFGIILFDKAIVKNEFKLRKIFSKQAFSKYIYMFILPLPAIVVKITWIELIKIYEVGGNKIKPTSMWTVLVDLLTNHANGTQKTILYAFTDTVSNGALVGKLGISYLTCVMIFILLSAVLVLNIPVIKRKTYQVSSFFIVLGALFYAFLYFMAYETIFTGTEATTLASFARYMPTYLIGMILFVLMIMVKEFAENPKKTNYFTISLMASLIIVGSPLPFYYVTPAIQHQSVEFRALFAPYEKVIKTKTPLKSKVYFVAQNTNGMEYWVTRYNVTDTNTLNIDYNGWSIGKPYNENDIWTRDISAADWSKLLRNTYDYVFLYGVDDQFRQQFHSVFDIDSTQIQSGQVYKVNKSASGIKILELVN